MIMIGIACGAGLGTILRYGITNMGKKLWPGRPWATLIINVLGAFVAGVLVSMTLSPIWRLTLATGVCGGFTTFSTFELDTLIQLNDHHVWRATGYVVFTLILGAVAFVAGTMVL